jgi:hypothetical protein
MTSRHPACRIGASTQGRLFICAGLTLAAAGCGGHQNSPPATHPIVAAAAAPLCSIETSFDATKPARERTFPVQNWFVLMLHSYRSTGEIARPLNDCSGAPVKMDMDGCGNEPMPRWTPTELTSEDLIVTSIGDARRLVWVVTERLSDGQAQGPVAIATIEARGISVRALGLLRTYPENLSLRLERVNDATVLIADGQHCAEGQAADSCERAIRLLPLVGDRFVTRGLSDAQGSCLGGNLFPVRATGTSGKTHATTYRLEASMTFSASGIVIHEHLDLSRAAGPRAPKDQARESFVTNLQLERHVGVRNGRLVTDGSSLLARWLAQQSTADSRHED